jgi:uncharacterized protein YrrD
MQPRSVRGICISLLLTNYAVDITSLFSAIFMQCVKCNNTAWFITHLFISQENVTFLFAVSLYDYVPDDCEIKSESSSLYENFDMPSKDVRNVLLLRRVMLGG